MKLSNLNEKGNEIKKELETAMASVGEAFSDADKENAVEVNLLFAPKLLKIDYIYCTVITTVNFISSSLIPAPKIFAPDISQFQNLDLKI